MIARCIDRPEPKKLEELKERGQVDSSLHGAVKEQVQATKNKYPSKDKDKMILHEAADKKDFKLMQLLIDNLFKTLYSIK